MTQGILHLRPVRMVAPREEFVERNLFMSIREATDTDHGRMLTLEEQALQLLSFFPLVDHGSYLVRIANVDGSGKPFARIGFSDTLYQKVRARLAKSAFIYESGHDAYAHHYHPGVFADSDYLYVPDNTYCKTVVVILQRQSRR